MCVGQEEGPAKNFLDLKAQNCIKELYPWNHRVWRTMTCLTNKGDGGDLDTIKLVQGYLQLGSQDGQGIAVDARDHAPT